MAKTSVGESMERGRSGERRRKRRRQWNVVIRRTETVGAIVARRGFHTYGERRCSFPKRFPFGAAAAARARVKRPAKPITWNYYGAFLKIDFYQSDTRARFPRFLFFIFFSPLFFSVYFRRSDHVGRNVRPSFFHISDADTSAARFFIDPSSTPDRCVHRIFMKPRSVPNLLDFNYNPVPRN